MSRPSFDYASRVTALQDLMVDGGVDVVVLSVGADLPYLTGYEATPSERLTALIVPSSGLPVLLVPELEVARVERGEFELRAWGELDDPVALAAGLVKTPESVAVGDHMWSVFLTRFQKEWTAASWRPASEITTQLRMIKDFDELDLLRRAAHAVDRVMARIPGEVRFSGRSEGEVARELAQMTIEEGHDVAEFTIVASGPNGASPHNHPGDRVMQPGDAVVCDYGGRLGGYYSDSTRTFAVAEPSGNQVEVHAVVNAANEASRDVIEPGIPCQEVDRAARRVVDESGYGDYFIHRTGHGIGLEVHEHPYMVEGNETALEPGMTFSVEPGIYLPGEFGVRIEDIVLCLDDGHESLNTSNRGLVVVS